MRRTSGRRQNNANQLMLDRKFVTITSPQHSLRGQQAEIISSSSPIDSTITVKLQDGTIVRLPLIWTDYTPPSKEDSGLHLLDIEGLITVVRLVKHVKAEEHDIK